jgi:hypothetical protein
MKEIRMNALSSFQFGGRMGPTRRAGLSFWLVLFASLPGLLDWSRAAEASGLAWKRETGSIALVRGDQTVWKFNFNADESKPSFHPVALPDGPVLTWYRPPDHRWHRGLWFSWKYINGLNYWEEDPRTGVSQGRTEWTEPRIESAGDFSARLSMDLSYRPPDGPPVLTERRTVRISPPDADGAYHLDWDMTFQAGAVDALLDRTPLPDEPNGQVFGGYAGLSVRFVRELDQRQAVTTEEVAQFRQARFRGKAPAVDYSGVIDGRPVGIAIVDHPANLNAPSPWYVINDTVMHYFSPAVICYAPYTLPAGQSFRLRYRVIVHPGRWESERLRAEAQRFAAARP